MLSHFTYIINKQMFCKYKNANFLSQNNSINKNEIIGNTLKFFQKFFNKKSYL